MKIEKVIYMLIPVGLIKKIKSLNVIISINHYRKVLNKECESIGVHSRIYKPISLKGLKYMHIGDNFKLDYYSILEAWDSHNNCFFEPEIRIGNNVSFGKYCHIGAINKVVIGNNVLIGSNVTIIDHNHGELCKSNLKIPPNKRLLYSNGTIIIEDNVWIGEKVTILANVVIGENSIIGANSIVTHDVPPNSVVGGIPARILKKL